MHPIAYIIYSIFSIADFLLLIIQLLLFIYIIVGLLTQLHILNPYKPFFKQWSWGRVYNGLGRWFDPILLKIRRKLPRTGMLDLSPLVLFFVLMIARYTLNYFNHSISWGIHELIAG